MHNVGMCFSWLISNVIATRNNLFIANEQKRQLHSTVWPVTELCCCMGMKSGPVKSVCPKPNDTLWMHIHLAPPANAPATWCPQSITIWQYQTINSLHLHATKHCSHHLSKGSSYRKPSYYWWPGLEYFSSRNFTPKFEIENTDHPFSKNVKLQKL